MYDFEGVWSDLHASDFENIMTDIVQIKFGVVVSGCV